jgi:ribosomal protein L34E
MNGIETAECRACGLKLVGDPYHKSRTLARHPVTGDVCSVNFYGGYVCSDECDRAATARQRRSIDDHAGERRRTDTKGGVD